jgi:hypothetical protein
MNHINNTLNGLTAKLSVAPTKEENEANRKVQENLKAYDEKLKKEQLEYAQQTGVRKINATRTTIALFKAKIFLTDKRLKDGKSSIIRYNLQSLDDNAVQAYFALENSVRKEKYAEPLFSHVEIYERDPDIPNGTPLGKYPDIEAFPNTFFRYYKNPALQMKYFQEVQSRIRMLRAYGNEYGANFLELIMKRAINF